MLIDSFKKYPRTYLFENMQTNQAYNDNALLKMLREITKLPNITNQIMRSIYVTWAYKNGQTYEAKDSETDETQCINSYNIDILKFEIIRVNPHKPQQNIYKKFNIKQYNRKHMK